jgi:hypothetical protein
LWSNRNKKQENIGSCKIIQKRMDEAELRQSLVSFNKDPSQEFSPETIVTYYKSLTNNTVTPDQVMVEAIRNVQCRRQLLLLSLALRYGANPNTYIQYSFLGSKYLVHTLVYSAVVSPSNCTRKLLQLLLAFGADPGMYAFEYSEGYRKDYTTNSRFLPSNIQEKVTDDILILSDRELGKLLDPDSVALSIRSFSGATLREQIQLGLIDSQRPFLMDNRFLVESVLSINYEAFYLIGSRGVLPSYLLLNRMVINTRKYYEKGLKIPLDEMKNILYYTSQLGVSLDEEQFLVLPPDVREELGLVPQSTSFQCGLVEKLDISTLLVESAERSNMIKALSLLDLQLEADLSGMRQISYHHSKITFLQIVRCLFTILSKKKVAELISKINGVLAGTS